MPRTKLLRLSADLSRFGEGPWRRTWYGGTRAGSRAFEGSPDLVRGAGGRGRRRGGLRAPLPGAVRRPGTLRRDGYAGDGRSLLQGCIRELRPDSHDRGGRLRTVRAGQARRTAQAEDEAHRGADRTLNRRGGD
jgi:hypothetical protein